MAIQIVRSFRRTVSTHVIWRRGQMIHLLPEHPRPKRGVRQYTNAEDKVCRITVGVVAVDTRGSLIERKPNCYDYLQSSPVAAFLVMLQFCADAA